MKHSDLAEIMALEGWCPKEKALWTYNAIRHIADGGPVSITEVGVFGGRWLLTAAVAIRDSDVGGYFGGYALGIDPYSKAGGSEGWAVDSEHNVWWSTVDLHTVRDKALAAIEQLMLSRWCGIVQSPAECVAKVVHCNQQIIHIDGNHSEVASVRDVHTWIPKLAIGGLLILDDCHWETVQSARKILQTRLKLSHQADTWEVYQR